jgi:electron transport complex protein RnfB
MIAKMKDLNLILTSIIVMAVLGGLLALGLSFAYRKLKVEEDPKLKKIFETLPGLNCGACGYASCEDFAKKLLEGEAPLNACKPGGEKTAEELEGILGKGKTVQKDKKKARLKCNARRAQKTKAATYGGLTNCLAASAFGSSFLGCLQGCFGLGDCVSVCPVSAIEMKEGRPQINIDRCVGCGLCVNTCPRGLIEVVSLKESSAELVVVGCNSTQSGAVTRKMCKGGCIGCGKCIKACPVSAISLENNLALIDPSKCTGCKKCIEACPTQAIYITELQKKT